MLKYLSLLVFVGCAAESYYLKQTELLPYKESSQITKLNQVSKTLKITGIIDQRTDKTIGFAYTGVEYKKTPLYFQEGLEPVLVNQVASALQMRNVEVSDNSGIELSVILKELKVEELIEKMKPERATCKLAMDFSLKDGETAWTGSYWASFTSAGDLSDGTERLAPTLASCLNEVIEKLVNDEKFTNIINKEAENGNN